jgi:glutathione-specific gamma-glutamylcyclotransferase
MTGATEHWVFGYGSLMWRPGFKFVKSFGARLEGYHRSLCVRSHIYRGTDEVPGAVMALRSGGFVDGRAFMVRNVHWPETLAYLRGRELVTGVYHERVVSATLHDDQREINAVTYVVNEAHEQFLGGLTRDEILQLVRQGIGQAGRCDDYVRNTSAELKALGVNDPELDEIVAAL